jgi:hypothetical protein
MPYLKLSSIYIIIVSILSYMINPYYLKIKLNMSMYSVQEKDII